MFSTANWLKQLENLWKKHSKENEKLDFSFFLLAGGTRSNAPVWDGFFWSETSPRLIVQVSAPSSGNFVPSPPETAQLFLGNCFSFELSIHFHFICDKQLCLIFSVNGGQHRKVCGKCQNQSKTYDLKHISNMPKQNKLHLRQIIGWVKPKIKWKIWLHKYCSTLRRCWPAYPSISPEQKHPLEIASIIAAGRCL